MSIDPPDVDRSLEVLLRVVRAQPGAGEELETSRSEFFHGAAPTGAPGEGQRASRRFFEWFLLERPCAALGGVPIEWALHRFDTLAEVDLGEEQLRALLSSRCSVFQVTGVAQGEGVWVRDLAALGEYPLAEPEGSHALEADDVIVGRLFAVGDSLYRASPAAGVFRNQELLRALTNDLEALRRARRGVLRLSQSELETMFWRRAESEREDPIELARAFLADAGVEAAQIDAILAQLAHAQFDPQRVVVGGHDVLGTILDRLAFDTEIDLERARSVLFDAWCVLSDTSSERSTTRNGSAPRDPRAAIEAFDRGRDAGRDLETLFRELENDLDLEAESVDPDANDGAPAPDFPGVVGAMVEEFLWETERSRGADAAQRLAVIRAFSEFGAGHGVFENLGARDLILFASVWLAERGQLRNAAEARAMLAALREFCAWAQDSQDVELLRAYDEHLPPLEESLPRLVEANRWCLDGSGRRSEVFECVEVNRASARLRDHHGEEFLAALDSRVLAALRAGDRLRGARSANGACDVFRCYPAESRQVVS